MIPGATMGARWVFVLLFVLMLCTGTAVRAQDDPKFGITMETPTTVGVIWHLSNVVAIQPEIGFSTSSSEGERSTTDLSSITTGVSARMYFHSWDKVRAYVSPKYGYSRLTQHGGSSSLTLENKNVTNSFTASFGVQYAPHKKFAVFGETGVTYSRLTFTSSSNVALLGSESATNGWRSGSSVGVTFYLW
jgi:hypothetical protein